jgi:hypothetical protein
MIAAKKAGPVPRKLHPLEVVRLVLEVVEVEGDGTAPNTNVLVRDWTGNTALATCNGFPKRKAKKGRKGAAATGFDLAKLIPGFRFMLAGMPKTGFRANTVAHSTASSKSSAKSKKRDAPGQERTRDDTSSRAGFCLNLHAVLSRLVEISVDPKDGATDEKSAKRPRIDSVLPQTTPSESLP